MKPDPNTSGPVLRWIAGIILLLVALACLATFDHFLCGCYKATDSLPPCPGTPGACADYPTAQRDGGR
jgi:hypothetical protein